MLTVCELNMLTRQISKPINIQQTSDVQLALTVCFNGKSSSGSSFNPTMMCSFGASVHEPVGTSVAPVPSYSLSSKMLNGDLSTLTV